MAISHAAKMKGTKKFAAIFYITLNLHTKDSDCNIDVAQTSYITLNLHTKDSDCNIDVAQTRGNILNLFLFYCDWLM